MGTMSNNQDRRQGGSDDHRRGGERQRDLVGREKGIIEGSGEVIGWNESVNRLIDASPRFKGAVRAAYSRFCLPVPDSTMAPEHLLAALQYFLQIIVENLDERAGKVFLRPVTQEDIDAISLHDETLAGQQGQLINFSIFDMYARHLLKRVALDRGKRLGLFMLGGLVVVHMTKSLVRKIPIVGAFVNALVPTIIAGPAVGIAGAVYL
ncbi:unnamed protein product [Calypogeia fissa]